MNHCERFFRFASQPFTHQPNRSCKALHLLLIGLFMSGIVAVSPLEAASLKTDSLSYDVGSQVGIIGSNFQAGETVNVVIARASGLPLPEGAPVAWEVVASGIPEPGSSGDTYVNTGPEALFIEGAVSLDGFLTRWTAVAGLLPGETLTLSATGQTSDFSASTSFVVANTKFHQLQNGTPANPEWSGGAINSNNSCYGEGQTIPYRYFMLSTSSGTTYTFEISLDATQGSGLHAFDYLSQYDLTESGPIVTVGGECSDIQAAAPADCATPVAVASLRDPRLLSSYVSAPPSEIADIIDPLFPIDGPGDLYAYNATDVQVGQYFFAPSSSGLELHVIISFEAVSNGSAGFFWGGHLAVGDPAGWGVGMGAGSISGAPFHMVVDGKSNLAVQAGTVCLPPDVTLTCDSGPYCSGDTFTCSVPTGATDYTWTVTGGTILTGQGTNSITYKITALPGDPVNVHISACKVVGLCNNQNCCAENSIQYTAADCCQVDITCPPTATVECDQSTNPSNTGTATFTTTGTCPLPITISYTDTETAGACPQEKTISRLWKATDANGQLRAQCTQTINVVDNTPPVLSNCPAPVTVQCNNIPAPGTPKATDNCDPAPTITMTESTTPGSCPQQYTLTRTWTATDACGNSSSCSQVITVQDTEPPVITCPQWIAVQCLADVPAPNPALVTAVDNCDPAPVKTFVGDVSNGQTCPETITRTYQATDACGNSATCTQTIIVDDTTPPVVTCPADISVQCLADVPAYNTGLVSATDNCDPSPVIAWLSDQVSGTTCPKIITRTYKAIDDCGNIGTCVQTITVDDTMPPVIVCPPNTSVTCGQSSDPSATGYATATDNCTATGSIAITYSDFQNGGGITRTWTATDGCGNQASCQQFIGTPPDTTPPQITCPDDFSVDCFVDVPAPDPLLVTVYDLCDPSPVVVHVSDVQSGTSCPYTITRTYTATDAAGNSAMCAQTITIDDNTPPQLLGCPQNATVECDAIPAPANVTATDNCPGVSVTFAEVETPGQCDQEKIITRTWTATDFCGNQASCSQVITVQDNTPPVITSCPDAISVQCVADIPTPDPNLVSATDNCDPNPIIAFVNDVSDGQSCPETITRTYQATDDCGNVAYCYQIITVDDTTPPEITCPAPVSVQCLSQVPQPNIALCSATDNCDPTPTITFVSDDQAGTGCPITITRTYKATDDCGNEATCQQIITVDDTTPPQISCPDGVTVECIGDVPQPNPGLCAVSDNCDANPTVIWVSDTPQGSCPMIITRVYKATDDCGNEATCQQVITVDDQTPPQLVGCPSNVSASCDNIPDPENVTATDNCPGVSVTFAETTAPGSCEQAYTITRTWTAIDACNNQAQCQQVITVYDNTPPQLSCPQGIEVECFSEVPTPDPGLCAATDNCDPAPVITFVSDVPNGTSCPLTITRTYKATDACGNEATCQQTIMVNDQTPPVLVGCPQNVTVDCGGDQVPPVAVVTATDNCDGVVAVVFSEVTTPGNCVYNYTVTRTWTATDACENEASCQQVITVQDITPPQITCPGGVTIDCIGDVPQPNPASCTATDNCDLDPVVVWVSDVAGQQRCPALITRTYMATDVCGNEATCTQTITVDDNTAPAFTVFPSDQTIFQCDPAEICLAVAAEDNCLGNVILAVTNGPGAIVDGQWCVTPTVAASYDVTISATDTCGNSAEDMFHVDYQLNRAPSFTNCPEDARIHWGDTYTVDLDASDPDAGQTLTYSLCPGAPEGTTINSTTGLLQFPTGPADVCDPEICVIVKDNCQDADTCEFSVCVYNNPPEFDLCAEDQVACYGYPFADSVHATDSDHSPYLFYYLLSGPQGVSVNVNTGVISWANPNPGAHEICVLATDSAKVCDPCSPSNADTCCFDLRVVSLDLVIEKKHDQVQGQFTEISIDFMHQGSNWPIAGFDLLIQYDNSALAFQKAEEGKFFTDCVWEYFTYRFGASGNCGAGACPTGVLRIVALAETNGGDMSLHPDCYANDGVADPGPGSTTSTELAVLTFLVSNDRTLECQFAPIRFVWYDCGDNSLSDISGDTLFISNLVYDYAGEIGEPPVVQWDDITGRDNTFPTLTGALSPECNIRDKFELVRCANFYNGGVDIICADLIDAPGDINMNGIPYEIADAVMFTNYFISGLSAFADCSGLTGEPWEACRMHQEGAIAASDVNRDGVALSVSDLVYVIRVVVGDALPYFKDAPMAAVPVDYSIKDGVITLSGDVAMGGAALVVRGQVTPLLLAAGMEMTYAYDGGVTRIVVTPPLEAPSLHTFRGSFLSGLAGEVISLDLATAEGAPVVARNTPNDYSLSQNYPNPFNPSTKINVALKQAGDYALTIYNVQGQVVEVISGSTAGPERLEIIWNASGFASGVYLYRLDAGQFTQTRKMLLLK